jgi:hypothetical protein
MIGINGLKKLFLKNLINNFQEIGSGDLEKFIVQTGRILTSNFSF